MEETLQRRIIHHSTELITAIPAAIAYMPRILTFDGGGVRGLSSLLILREIMEQIKQKTKSSETPTPCRYFDLIGGTSTGGLLAIMVGLLGMVLFGQVKLTPRLLMNASISTWNYPKKYLILTKSS